MNNSAQQTLLELIKNIAKNVGLDENKTVVEIQKTDNPNVKKLI